MKASRKDVTQGEAQKRKYITAMQQINWKQELLFLGTGLLVILVIESVMKVMDGALTPKVVLELVVSISWKVMALWVVRWVLIGRGK